MIHAMPLAKEQKNEGSISFNFGLITKFGFGSDQISEAS